MQPLNILYLNCHDSGRYASPYGYNIPTPNLQHFAEEGVTLRRAFCAAPSCSPSRTAMLTGQYPHQNGMFGLISEFQLNDDSRHLANWLKTHGYTTALSGLQHETAEVPDRLHNIGYDEILTLDDNGNDEEHLRIVDPGPTNNWMRDLGFANEPKGLELLYDLWLDPLEMVNHAEDPAYAEVRQELSAKLDQWMRDTGDPFPADEIPESAKKRK